MQNKAVFLDRDGVINDVVVVNGVPHPPKTLADVAIPVDALSALQQLKAAGYQLIVVTNQPDVARGKTSRETVEAINLYLTQQLPLDAVYVCYHDDTDDCECRKPKPGLLINAAKQHDIQLSRSFMIGDRWRDIDSGKNAGCKTIFLNASYGESIDHHITADYSVTSLKSAAQWIFNLGE